MKRTQIKRKSTLKRLVGTLSKTRTKKAVAGQIGGKKKVYKPKKKAWKFVKSHLQECDEVFSLEIRARDGHCLYPGCVREDDLTCSHYFGRSTWQTRFYDDNCITLCRFHHYNSKLLGYEYQKQQKGVKDCLHDGQYTIFMKEFLGEYRWNALLEREQNKLSRKEVLLEAQKRYNLRQPEALLEKE